MTRLFTAGSGVGVAVASMEMVSKIDRVVVKKCIVADARWMQQIFLSSVKVGRRENTGWSVYVYWSWSSCDSDGRSASSLAI